MASESEGRAALGVGGVVTIGDRMFSVKPLSLDAEYVLGEEFRKLAKKQMGPGGYFADSREVLKWLEDNKLNGILTAHIQNLSGMEAKKELPGFDAAEEARKTPEGVALEMFYRTRETHAEIGLAEFSSTINAVNAPAIAAAIRKVIAKSDDPKTTPSS